MFPVLLFVTALSFPLSARWDAGDYQKREMKVSHRLPIASIELSVRAEGDDAYWLISETSPYEAAPLVRKETLIERGSGKTLRTVVDGREIQPPAPVACETLSEVPETITVRAGTFATLRRMEKCGRDVFVSWRNDALINMNGEALRALLHSGSTNPQEIYLETELVEFGRTF